MPGVYSRRAKPFLVSITSSARPSNNGGIFCPQVLAVFRLITRMYLVGCSMGRPAGLVPSLTPP